MRYKQAMAIALLTTGRFKRYNWTDCEIRYTTPGVFRRWDVFAKKYYHGIYVPTLASLAATDWIVAGIDDHEIPRTASDPNVEVLSSTLSDPAHYRSWVEDYLEGGRK